MATRKRTYADPEFAAAIAEAAARHRAEFEARVGDGLVVALDAKGKTVRVRPSELSPLQRGLRGDATADRLRSTLHTHDRSCFEEQMPFSVEMVGLLGKGKIRTTTPVTGRRCRRTGTFVEEGRIERMFE